MVSIVSYSHPSLMIIANVKAVVAAFNQEKALVGAFSVITNLRMELFEALIHTNGVRNRGPSFKSEPFELNIFWGKIIAAIKFRRVYLIPAIIIFFME